MKAFGKTLFGDLRNVAVVAAMLTVEAVLVQAGLGRDAAYLMPVALLAAAAYLAQH